MKRYLICVLIRFMVLILVTYLLGLGDDVYIEKYHEGIWYKDILNSIKYYILWVLPYWWLIILVGSLILGAVLFGIKTGIGKLLG